jgi:uncharacterized membrane protein YbaN (DUF454 family)
METPARMKKLTPSVSLWRTAVGWALICAGVIGMILPVLPGVPLLIGGLVVLSARYRWAAVGVKWLKRKVWQVANRKAVRKETIGA